MLITKEPCSRKSHHQGLHLKKLTALLYSTDDITMICKEPSWICAWGLCSYPSLKREGVFYITSSLAAGHGLAYPLLKLVNIPRYNWRIEAWMWQPQVKASKIIKWIETLVTRVSSIYLCVQAHCMPNSDIVQRVVPLNSTNEQHMTANRRMWSAVSVSIHVLQINILLAGHLFSSGRSDQFLYR